MPLPLRGDAIFVEPVDDGLVVGPRVLGIQIFETY